jgi:hypothetical protein
LNCHLTRKDIELNPEFFRAKRPKIHMIYGAGIVIEDMEAIMYHIYEDPETYRLIVRQNRDT